MVEERTLELLLANEKLYQEIVERKKITDHLFVSQERFRKIFESSPSLMAILSLKDGIIYGCKYKLDKLYGLSVMMSCKIKK